MSAPYWGPFAELRDAVDPAVEEVDLYDGPLTRLYDEVFTLDLDLPVYRGLARANPGTVLELCCGTGRVVLDLARAGHDVVGVDRSAAALAELAARLEDEQETVRDRVSVHHKDVTRPGLLQLFPLVLLPGFTWTLFDEATTDAVLEQVARHLAPGGVFAFDYPRYEWAARDLWDGQVTYLRLPHPDGPVTCQVGVRTSDDGTHLVTNSYWALPGTDGPRHFLESKQVAVVDDERLARQLADHGLRVHDRTTVPLAPGVCDWRLVECGADVRRSYPLWHPYTPRSVEPAAIRILREGQGSRVRDVAGRELVDLSGGLWSTQCGLGHPDVIDAAATQLQRLSYATLFAGRGNEPALLLARRLVALAPDPLSAVFLTGSGSESVELSMKLARLHGRLRGTPERTVVLHLDASYHGTFFGSMGVSGTRPEKEDYAPLLPGTRAVPAPLPWRRPGGTTSDQHERDCLAVLERTLVDLAGRAAAFVLEPVLGSSGAVVLPDTYLHGAERLCRQHGVLLVVDEVATGFGRTGRWFACEHTGVRPDMLLLAKGITSGYLPLGAVLVSDAVDAVLATSPTGVCHGSSHNGNPVCCAAALAAIDVLQRDGLVERAARLGAWFRELLDALTELPSVGAVHGLGLLLALELQQTDGSRATPQQSATVLAALQTAGVLAYPQEAGLAFVPALTVEPDDLLLAVELLRGILTGVALTDGQVRTAP